MARGFDSSDAKFRPYLSAHPHVGALLVGSGQPWTAVLLLVVVVSGQEANDIPLHVKATLIGSRQIVSKSRGLHPSEHLELRGQNQLRATVFHEHQ